MELIRDIYEILELWFTADIDDVYSKPLIVEGVRQVGKTTTINNFLNSKNVECVSIDLSNYTEIHEVINSLNVDKIIDYIKLTYNINTEKLIIFFDEAQTCLKLIQVLKYFREKYPHIKIIVSGSLLSLKINNTNIMYPTGKVNIIEMLPLSFEEFVNNINPSINLKIKECLEKCDVKNFNLVYKEYLKKMYNEYLIVGGMPESVKNYINELNKKSSNNFVKSLITINSIKNSYKNDIKNHFGNENDQQKANAIFDSIHTQMNKENKRFFLSEIPLENRNNDNNKFRNFKFIFWKLFISKMVNYIYFLSDFKIPFNNFVEQTKFKLYYSDVSLYTSTYKIDLNDINFNTPQWNVIKGGVIENFAFNQLKYYLTEINIIDLQLYTYSKNNKNENLEIDFLMYKNDLQPIVIEVKSSTNSKSKSFDKLRNNFTDYNYIKFFDCDLIVGDQYLMIPIYLIGYFTKYIINSNNNNLYEKYKLKVAINK